MREREVLAQLMRGTTVRDIARDSVVSEATVRTQVKSILAKLKVASQLAAVGLAHDIGWRRHVWEHGGAADGRVPPIGDVRRDRPDGAGPRELGEALLVGQADRGAHVTNHGRVPRRLRPLRVHAGRAPARRRPGWVNVGELVDLARSVARADERCGCGEPFSRCPVWTRVGEVAFGGWAAAVLDRLPAAARRRPPAAPPRSAGPTRSPSAGSASCASAYTAVYRAVAEVTGSAVVVDASKGPALGAALAGAPGVDLRMLNVVRDPRAVAWSWRRTSSDPTPSRAATRCGGSRSAGRQRSGAPSSWRWRPSPGWRGAGRPGPLRGRRRRPVATLVDRDGTALGLPLDPADLPAAGGDGPAPSHGLSGNPGRFRSGRGAAAARRPVDPRDAGGVPGRRHGADAAAAATYGYPVGNRTTAPPLALRDVLLEQLVTAGRPHGPGPRRWSPW